MTNDKLICRTCAGEASEYRALHKKGLILGEITTLANLLSFCSNIEFPAIEAHLPSILCEKCVQKLVKAYQFKKQVLLINQHLRELYENSQVNVEDEQAESQYVMVSVVRSKYGSEEFIISEQIPDDAEVITFTTEDLEPEDAVIAAPKMEIEDKTKEENDDYTVIKENEKYDEHVEGDDVIEDTTNSQNVSLNDKLSIKSTKQNRKTFHNYVLAMADGEDDICVKSCPEEFSTEMDVETSQSDNQSRPPSPSQSPDPDLQSDSTNDKPTKITSSLKPVKKRAMKSKPKEHRPDLQCTVCSKQLSNANSYRYHMQLHSDDTPFLCSLCGEGFKTRNAYDGHKALHDPNNPNKCELCGKTYRQASSLRAHMYTHTEEKPFVCDICGKGMTQKSGYKKHMLTHTGEKPHVCDFCGREFRYSSNLIAHRRCHTGEKPYECPNCSKCFISSEQLKRHKIVHTGERPHTCKICDKRFKRRSTLAQHLQIHVNSEPTTDRPIEIKKERATKSNIIEVY